MINFRETKPFVIPRLTRHDEMTLFFYKVKMRYYTMRLASMKKSRAADFVRLAGFLV